MNIFVVDIDPRKAAENLCDKHVVKMIVETSQLLSTAHRVLDGTPVVERTANNRKITRWVLKDDHLNNRFCKAVMINHPCAIWARQSAHNYYWLHTHGKALCEEYYMRYGKFHSMYPLYQLFFPMLPKKLLDVPGGLTPFAQAMPEKYKNPDNAIQAYRNYYIQEKSRFAKWGYSPIPTWYREGLQELNSNKGSEVLTNA